MSTAEMVRGWDPLLANPTVALDWVPGAMPPKLIPVVVEMRLGLATSPEPVRPTVVVCELPERSVVTVSAPPAGPGAVGVKVAGTVIVGCSWFSWVPRARLGQ